MKKILSLVIALSMIFTLFAGCGNAAAPDPVSEPDPVPESSEPEPVPLAVEGTIKEASDDRIVVALGDGTDFVLDTAGLSDLDVRAGDTVRAEYTGAVGSAVAAKVEVTARAETLTVTGVVMEISSGFVFLTLEDGTDAALKTTTLEDYDVQVGDSVTIEYLEDGSVVSVEVAKAAGAEADAAAGASAAPDSSSSSQAAVPETAAPAASSNGGSSSNSSSSSGGGSSSGSGGSSYDGRDLNAWFFQYMAPYMEESDEVEDGYHRVDVEAYAYEVIDLANQERDAVGRSIVPIDDKLMELAAIRAGELEELWGHTRPNGESDSYLGAPDYRWVMCNLGKGYTSPAAAVNGWMNSTGHRNNILYEGHDKVGAGCYQGANGTLYWCIVYYREGGYYPDYPSPEP